MRVEEAGVVPAGVQVRARNKEVDSPIVLDPPVTQGGRFRLHPINNPNTFHDALAASAVSAGNSFPVLLVQNGSVPGPTGAALRDLDLSHRYIVGNKLSVSESVRTSLGVAVGDRISGADRYAIAAALAVRARSEGWLSNTFVGFAANIPDAATGGALMGKRGGALLYVSSSAIPAATSGYLLGTAGEITGATVFGGTSSVSEGVRVRLETLIQ